MEEKENPLGRQLQEAQKRLDVLWERARAQPPDQSTLTDEALEELSIALEELSVIGEELSQQNEKLIAAHETIERKQRQYRELFEFAPDGYLVTDPEGIIQRANHAAAALLNGAEEALIDKPLVAFVAEEERRDFHTHLTRLINEPLERVENWEMRIQPHKSPPFYVAITVSTVRSLDGELTGLRWLLRDVTDHRRTREALQRRNRQLAFLNQAGQIFNAMLDLEQVLHAVLEETRLLLNVAACSVWLVEPESGALVCRQATGSQSHIVQGWRLPPGEGLVGWVARHGRSLIVPDAREDERHSKKVDQETGLDLRSILSVPLKSKHDVLGVIQVLDAEVGRFDEADLTLLQSLAASAAIAVENARLYERAQEEIARRRQAERTLRTLLDAPTDSITLLDPKGTILDLNDVTVSRFHSSRDQLIGASVWELFPPDVAARRKAYVDEVFRSGTPLRLADERDGRWNDNVLYPIFDQQGQVVKVAVIARDVTEYKRTEETLQRQTKRLSILRKIDRAILEARSLEEVARTALQPIRDLEGGLEAGVIRLDVESGEVAILTSQVDGPPITRIETALPRPISDLVQRVITNLDWGNVEVVDDLSSIPELPPETRALRMRGGRSLLLVPMFKHKELLGVLYLASDRPSAFGEREIEIMREIADSLAVAVEQIRLRDSISQHRDELERLSAQLVDAQEAERRKISRDLHDVMGQALTAVSINLGRLMNELQDIPHESMKRLAQARAATDQTLQQIRNLSLDLRPPMLDDLGLEAALQWYVKRFDHRLNAEVMFKMELEQRLEREIEVTLYRVVQEALTNVARHAEAQKVRLHLACQPDAVTATVEDDGRGFETKTIMDDGVSTHGIGLLGIRERVKALGGTFDVQSEPGGGTRLSVEIPLRRNSP